MRIVTTSAAISGNKGAATMIEALVTHYRSRGGSVIVLTTYPDEDRALAEPTVGVVALKPLPLVFRDVPLALLARVVPARLKPTVVARSPALSAIASADVVADIAGVSFADERGTKFHVYNSMLTALPLCVGTPIVKCSQAMGPFRQRLNRVLAKVLLPKIDRVLARGDRSLENVRGLGLGLANLGTATDLAFTLDPDEQLDPQAERALAPLTGRDLIVVMPSAVVESWCERRGIDHTAVFAEVVAAVCDRLGAGVALVPHAYRASGKPRRMDDARVCRAVAERLGRRDDVVVVDLDLAPAQLRTLIGRADLLVASRFHGMVTGLAASIPTVVVGWGHKYSEVLDQFHVRDVALDYTALRDPSVVVDKIVETWGERTSIRDTLRSALPAVRAAAELNFAALDEVGGA